MGFHSTKADLKPVNLGLNAGFGRCQSKDQKSPELTDSLTFRVRLDECIPELVGVAEQQTQLRNGNY